MPRAESMPRDDYDARLLVQVHPGDWRNPQPKNRYDLVVIGAGSGGLASSAIAATMECMRRIGSPISEDDSMRRHAKNLDVDVFLGPFGERRVSDLIMSGCIHTQPEPAHVMIKPAAAESPHSRLTPLMKRLLPLVLRLRRR